MGVYGDSVMTMRQFLLITTILFASVPVAAQDGRNVEGRVVKLEKEMQAVQRQVFKGGAGGFFEPEIKPETPESSVDDTSPSAIASVNSRVDALEAQMARLNGQVEEQGNSIRLLTARLDALEKAAKSASAVSVVPATSAQPTAAVRPSATQASASAPVAASGNAERRQAIAALSRPETGDAFEDSYNYGYRLWESKFYPEAQQQLQETADAHGKHPRASFARNLLGRAYLDEKKPATAAKIFYDNYKADPRGERAPESLYYLGVALTDLKKPADACSTFQELVDAYPDVAAGRLADKLTAGRARAKCQ